MPAKVVGIAAILWTITSLTINGLSLKTSPSRVNYYHVCSSRLLFSINLHTKFEVPSFTFFKDVIGAPKFKRELRDTDHAPFYG